jgi:hypothetical protein
MTIASMPWPAITPAISSAASSRSACFAIITIRRGAPHECGKPLPQAQSQPNALLDRQPLDAIPLELPRAIDASTGPGPMMGSRLACHDVSVPSPIARRCRLIRRPDPRRSPGSHARPVWKALVLASRRTDRGAALRRYTGVHEYRRRNRSRDPGTSRPIRWPHFADTHPSTPSGWDGLGQPAWGLHRRAFAPERSEEIVGVYLW